jgi:hypothetical protein
MRLSNQISIEGMRALLAEVGIRDVPDEHFAQWKPAQQSLDVALARLPRNLSWSDEPTFRLPQSSGR